MFILIVVLWMAIQMQAPLWVFIVITFSMLLNIIDVVLKCIEKKQEEDRRKRRVQAIANGDFEELLKTMGEQDGK